MERGHRLVTLVALGLAGIGIANILALDPFDPSPSKASARYAGRLAVDAGLVILGFVCLAHGLSLAGSTRVAVSLMAVGFLGYAFGSWYSSYANFSGIDDVPYPSFANFGYLAMPVSACVAVCIFLRASGRKLQGIDLALGVIVPLTVLIVFYAVLIQPKYDPSAAWTRTFVDLAHPTLDALYVALAAILIFFTRSASNARAYRLLAGVMVFLAVSDVVFTLEVDRGSYFTGSWIDAMHVAVGVAYALTLLRFSRSAPADDQHVGVPVPAG